MPPISANTVLIVASILFVLGMVGVLTRKNIIFMLLSVEIMLNASGLAFVAAGSKWHQPDGQVMFLFILAMAAAEVSVALALVLQIYHQHKTLDVEQLKELRDEPVPDEPVPDGPARDAPTGEGSTRDASGMNEPALNKPARDEPALDKSVIG